jgi:RNA polymerase sigma-70 factor (ECF subfamily)
LVQETLLRAYTHLHLLQGVASVGGWLFKIQLNLLRNGYRRADRLARPRTSLVSLDEGWVGKVYTVATPDPERCALHCWQQAALLQALAGLPAAYREAVLLCDVEGKSYQEIAERTGAASR